MHTFFLIRESCGFWCGGCSWESYRGFTLWLQKIIFKVFILKRELDSNKRITSWDLSLAATQSNVYCCVCVCVCSWLFICEFTAVLHQSHWFNLWCTMELSNCQWWPRPIFITWRYTEVSQFFDFPKGCMCLQRDNLNPTNKQHWLVRFLSHSHKPHCFRDLLKDKLIKNLLPFFHVNQLTSARPFSGAWATIKFSVAVLPAWAVAWLTSLLGFWVGFKR